MPPHSLTPFSYTSVFPYPILLHTHIPLPHLPTHPCPLTPFSHTSTSPYPIPPTFPYPIPPTHPCSLTPFSYTSMFPYPFLSHPSSLTPLSHTSMFPFHDLQHFSHFLSTIHFHASILFPFPGHFWHFPHSFSPHPLPHSPVLYCVAAAVQYVFMWSLQRLAIVAHFVFTFCSALQQSWIIFFFNCSSVGVAFGVGGGGGGQGCLLVK